MNKSKTKIVIASVLKPVDDVRNYEKIATSLATNSHYDITIVGTEGDSVSKTSNIIFRNWEKFKRLSLKRLSVQHAFWEILKEINPELIICTTFELLFVTVIFRIRNRTKILYDIQEDYFKNLWYQKFYPFGIRHFLGLSVRGLELSMSPFISGYTLAEKIYEKNIRFTRRKSLVLENKSLPISRANQGAKFKVIFTGTISTYSRALESIELYLKVSQHLPNSVLVVIGYVPSVSYQTLLISKFEKLEQIKLKLSTVPVSHSTIVEEISTANLAIIGYQPNPVNRLKMPTKLYEYTTARIPYLVQKDTHWAEAGGKLGGAIPIDFNQPDSINILDEIKLIKAQSFLESGFLWTENQENLLEYIDHIIN